MIYIGMYLGAIVVANLVITWLGASAAIWTAFLFIGLDLTARDHLHEVWHNHGLIWKMALLIASGSLLSYLLNHNSGSVALASFIAFVCAAVVDTLTYALLHEKAYLIKVNGSNIFSAAIDSLIFPTLAFGMMMPVIILGQFIAKVGGGFIWSLILKRRKDDI